MRSPIEAVLFDLGGIVLDISFARALAVWREFSELNETELRVSFRFDECYKRHERGEISGTDYLQHLRETLRLNASDEQVLAGWNAIFIGLMPASVEIITALRAHKRCYAFTNTNALHAAFWRAEYPQTQQMFEHIFVSSQMRMRKPEAAAFAYTLREMQLDATQVLFVDDTQSNVDGARVAGLHAEQVDSAASLTAALAAHGLCSPELQ